MEILEFLASKGLLSEAMENVLKSRGTEFEGDGIEDAMAFVEQVPKIDSLMAMFPWMDSKEGHDFWYEVHTEFKSQPENKEFMTTWDACVAMGIEDEVAVEVMLQTPRTASEVVEYLTQSHGLVTSFSFDAAVKGRDYWKEKNEEFMEFTGMTDEDILMRLLAIK